MAKDPRHDTGSRSRHSLPTEAQIKLRFDKFASFVAEYSSLVSRSGVFLKTDQLRPAGSEVSFDFRLVDGFRLFQGQGQVVWVRPVAAGPDRPQGLGVRFAALDEKGRELVLKILEEQLKSGGAPFEIEKIPTDATADWQPPSPSAPAPNAAIALGPPASSFAELGEEPTLISRPKVGESTGSFDAPWGERLPEIPTDLLDEGEPPVLVPSVSSPTFADDPKKRRPENNPAAGLFQAAFPGQLQAGSSPTQLGFDLDDAPTAPVSTAHLGGASSSKTQETGWDAGRVTSPMFAGEPAGWTFDVTDDDTLLPAVEDPLVDLDDEAESFSLDDDEQPTMVGRAMAPADAGVFVFDPPGDDGELDEMVLPEPVVRNDLPKAVAVGPVPAPAAAPGPIAPALRVASPWEVTSELPPWQSEASYAKTAPIPHSAIALPGPAATASPAPPPASPTPVSAPPPQAPEPSRVAPAPPPSWAAAPPSVDEFELEAPAFEGAAADFDSPPETSFEFTPFEPDKISWEPPTAAEAPKPSFFDAPPVAEVNRGSGDPLPWQTPAPATPHSPFASDDFPPFEPEQRVPAPDPLPPAPALESPSYSRPESMLFKTGPFGAEAPKPSPSPPTAAPPAGFSTAPLPPATFPAERPLVPPGQYGAAAAWNPPIATSEPDLELGPENEPFEDEVEEKPGFFQRRAGKLAIAAVLLAALGAGAFLLAPLFTGDSEPPVAQSRPAARPRAAEPPAAPVDREPATPVITSEPAAEPLATPAAGDQAAPPAAPVPTPSPEPAPVPSPPAATASDARYLESLRLSNFEDRTEIVAEFDAEIGSDQFQHDPMSTWTDQKERVILTGLLGTRASSLAGQGPRVRAVRVGEHGGPIWLVIDKNPPHRVLSVLPNGRRLTIVLGR